MIIFNARLMGKKVISRIIILTITGLFLSSCFGPSGYYKIVNKTKQVKYAELKLNIDDSNIPKKGSGISIDIKPISSVNNQIYPQFRMDVPFHYDVHYTVRECNRYECWNKEKTRVETNALSNVPIFPYPAFEVKISNNTDHVLKFNNTVLAMEDGSGNLYDAMNKKSSKIFVNTAVNKFLKNFGLSAKQIKSAYDASEIYLNQQSISLLDENFKVLPNKTKIGYMVFQTGNYNYNAYEKFLLQQESLDIQLYEIPIEVDQAGKITKTESYSFKFDVGVLNKNVDYKIKVFVPTK